jgi:hypothetical protein
MERRGVIAKERDVPPRVEHPAPPLLAYADLPARHGIQYDVRPNGASFLVPPTSWWKRPEIIVAIVVTSLFVILMFADMSSNPRRIIRTSATVAMVLVATVAGTMRLRRPMRIDVTPDALVLENVMPFMSTEMAAARVMRYPRHKVYDVQFVGHSGNVIIRVRDNEMIEFSPSTDPRLKSWLAQELRRALGLPA